MKGLLLKSWYMTWSYCRSFLLLIIVFLLISPFAKQSLFFIAYPSIIAGMMPVTLLAYEERCKWNLYSDILPVSRRQVVSEKYIIALISICLITCYSAIILACKMLSEIHFNWHRFDFGGYSSGISTLMSVSLIAPSFLFPFIFKFGTEKGRIFYYIIIGFACALFTSFSNQDIISILPQISAYVLLLFALFAFAFSWLISMAFYEKRTF